MSQLKHSSSGVVVLTGSNGLRRSTNGMGPLNLKASANEIYQLTMPSISIIRRRIKLLVSMIFIELCYFLTHFFVQVYLRTLKDGCTPYFYVLQLQKMMLERYTTQTDTKLKAMIL